MPNTYTLLLALLAAWEFDEPMVDNYWPEPVSADKINGYVGWYGLYITPTELACLSDTDPITTTIAGPADSLNLFRSHPQPLTLA